MPNYIIFSLILTISAFIVTLKIRKRILFFFLYGISSTLILIYGVAHYITGEGVTSGFIFHFYYGIQSAPLEQFKLLIVTVLLLLIFNVAFIWLGFRYWNKYKRHTPKETIGLILLTLAIILNPFFQKSFKYFGFSLFGKELSSKDLKKSIPLNDLNNFSLKSEHPLPHLVFIFLESFEESFTRDNHFKNLTPYINKLKEHSLNFTELRQDKGQEYTISGMTAAMCGVPLLHSSEVNTLSSLKKFLPRALCVGDILKTFGYNLSFIQGSDVNFAGTKALYQSHSFDNIIDSEDIINELKIEKVNWGVSDFTLLDYAFNYFKKSTKQGKTALFLATIDTHFPGYESKECVAYKKDKNFGTPILNAAYCLDFGIEKFIKNIENSDKGDNTILVLLSDHLAIGRTAKNLFKNIPNRKNFFLIKSKKTKRGKAINKVGSHIDVATTILDFIGINGQVGVGVSLLNDKPTLISQSNDDRIKGLESTVKKLWDFPNSSSDVHLNPYNKTVKIGKDTYKFPVLIKLNKDQPVDIFFQNGGSSMLRYLSNRFLPDDAFIYVDHCQNLDGVFGEEAVSEIGICYALGKLGGNVVVKNLSSKNTIQKNDLSGLFAQKTTMETFTLQTKKLKALGFLSNKQRLFLKRIPKGARVLLKKSVYLPLYKDSDIKSAIEDYFDVQMYRSIPFYNSFYALEDELISREFLNPVYNIETYKKVGFWHLLAGKFAHNVLKACHRFSLLEKVIPYSIQCYLSSLAKVTEQILYLTPSRKDIQEITIKQSTENNCLQKSPEWCRFIAHAGGRIDGHNYTNSLDALNLFYSKGFRLFELDILRTSDSSFVAAHDWNHWARLTGFKGIVPVSQKTFNKYKIHGKYAPLDIDQIVKWFGLRKDAYLVTDKIDNPIDFVQAFPFHDRLIMELFTPQSLAEALALKIHSPMPNYDLISKYGVQTPEILKQIGIKNVAFNSPLAISHPAIFQRLRDKNIRTFAYNLVFVSKEDSEQYFVENLFHLIYGIYADEWTIGKNE